MNDRHPNHPDNIDRQTGEIHDEPVEGEIMDPIPTGVLAVLQRTEIDQQVATAKAYPRNVPMIKKELTALVTMDEDTADDCIYALPRGQKHIKGPSARFADALISYWGNARSGAFITQVNKEEKFVEAIGSFQDVERNVIRQRRVRRPISDRNGRVYNADMINMTGNAACVIAERNAILNGIPKSLWGPAYEQAFALVAGTTKTLGEKLERAEKAFALMGISMDQVLAKIDRQDISKVLPDDIVTMRGMLTALKTGEETVETIFGRGAGSQHERVYNPLKDDPPRGASTVDSRADKVTGADEKVTKDRDPISSARGPTQEKRNMAETATSSNDSGTKVEQTESSGKVTTGLAASNEGEKIDMPLETSGKATGAAAKGAAAEQRAASVTEQTASQTKPAAANAAKSYDDAESYMEHMRDLFARAKASTTIVDAWGATRADRNELLSEDQIDLLTEEKKNKIEALKQKGAK